MHMTQGQDHGIAQSFRPLQAMSAIGIDQASIEPADKIAGRDVAHEHEEAEGCLVEASVPQVELWKRASAEQGRLVTRPRRHSVTAVIEHPITP